MPAHSAAPPPTSYAIKQYAPRPERERQGIALCLSGGGYRATLFHLGALRRLNELGILGKLTTISSVSGGSIMAAHLATRIPWPLNGPLPDWESRVAAPLRALTARNIRTVPLLKRYLLPWNWFRSSTQVKALANQYVRSLTTLKLSELPPRPRFLICATDMAFGLYWAFERERMGDSAVGYVKPPPTDWSLGLGVAASSCFPPLFDPLPVRLRPEQFSGGRASLPERRTALEDLRLTDGGVYDNLGLEAVWKDHEIVLVSDGGAPFNPEPDKNLLWRLQRYFSIVAQQGLSLRKRWLISNFIASKLKGTYWGISSAVSSYDMDPAEGYSKALAEEDIARIRTDLDAFSHAEAAILENHGYTVADAAIRRHLPEFVPSPPPSLDVPHPDWMDEGSVTEALAESHKRKLLGRW